MKHLYLGTSGWSYKSWGGAFYPAGLSSGDYLSHYVRHFRAIEIDSTFYAIPRLQTVQRWHRTAPDEFLFCPKFPRIITHEKMLSEAGPETALFLNTMDALSEHLGPLILQFEYKFSPDYFNALQAYLQSLPAKYRYAVEVRNPKWLTDDFFFTA